ncbi:MAG: hypothetical protein ABI946_02885 [Chthoniobacterales bacterium]
MRLKFLVYSLAGILIALGGCKKPDVASKPRENVDSCSLLTKDEVATIAGSPIRETKGSERREGAFLVSQCFYTAETPLQSVSLALTQATSGAPDARKPKEFWDEKFGRFRGTEASEPEEKEREKTKERGEGEEEKRARPKKVQGVGDEAFWANGQILYVLKGQMFLRISVGGVGNEEDKIGKSKALAIKALERVSTKKADR